jgi:hypothetical protein
MKDTTILTTKHTKDTKKGFITNDNTNDAIKPLEHVAQLTDRLEKGPTYQSARQGEERLVNTGSTFVAHIQPTKAMQPGEGALDDPTCSAKSAAVLAVPVRVGNRFLAILAVVSAPFGSSGSIRVHKSPSTRAWLIADRLAVGQPTVPSLASETRGRSVD